MEVDMRRLQRLVSHFAARCNRHSEWKVQSSESEGLDGEVFLKIPTFPAPFAIIAVISAHRRV